MITFPACVLLRMASVALAIAESTPALKDRALTVSLMIALMILRASRTISAQVTTYLLAAIAADTAGPASAVEVTLTPGRACAEPAMPAGRLDHVDHRSGT